MRIVCQKCAAAYAIDDRWVSKVGVRAQCPRCRAIQQVTSQDALPRPEAQNPTLPFMRKLPSNVPSHTPVSLEVSVTPASPELESDSELIDDSLLRASSTTASRCRVCGSALTDVFDRALEVCSNCSNKDAAAIERTDVYPPPSQEEEKSEPLTVVGRPSDEELPVVSDAYREEARSYSEETAPLPMEEDRARRGWVIAVLIVVLVTVAALLTLAKLRPERKPVVEPLSPVVAAAVARWKPPLATAIKDSSLYLSEASALVGSDTPEAYGRAARLFQLALVAHPRSDEAIAGYVQALALSGTVDGRSYEEAKALIEVAQARSSRDASTLVAQANLLLAHSDNSVSKARALALAEEALERAKGRDRVEALVVKGRVLISTAAPIASAALDEALGSPEAPARASYYRALVHRAQGEYRSALGALQRRLSMQPAHQETLLAVADIYDEVGEPERARDALVKGLEVAPSDSVLRMALAVLRYQSLGQKTLALDALRAISGNAELPVSVRRDAFVHLAAAERAGGNLESAHAAVREALGLDLTCASAHFQGLLAAIEQEQAEVAAAHFEGIRGRLESPSLEAMLEGRLLMLEKRFPEAQAKFGRAVELDSRWTVARLWAGAAAAAAGIINDGYAQLRKGLEADPTVQGPLPRNSIWFITKSDLLWGLQGRMAGLEGEANDPNPKLYEGLVRFHSEDWGAAENFLRQSLALNDNEGAAHAVRALVSLARSDVSVAVAHGERAVRSSRNLALAHYAHGEALRRAGEWELAAKALRQSLELGPSFYGAEVSLAAVDAQQGRAEEARKRLSRVIELDDSHLPAKRALYALEP